MADDNDPTSRNEEVSTVSNEILMSDPEEPVKKKIKTETQNLADINEDKLERRLGGILCCAVCLDLPRTAIYQTSIFYLAKLELIRDYGGLKMADIVLIIAECTNGHLMCAGCFTHLLADARLRDETATCPNCRIEINKTNSSRNLAVEKAVNELPAECQYCSVEFPRHLLDRHEKELCEERLTNCKYCRIGCMWRGPYHELRAHEECCSHPNKSGADVMDTLKIMDQKQRDEMELYTKIFDLLSFEKLTFIDLQLKPYRTDEFIHKLFYETSRFTAFNNQWVVKARINNNQQDPTQSCNRSLSYQVIMKSKVSGSLSMHYLILKGPFGDIKIDPMVYNFEFSDENCESPFHHFPLHDSAECNKLLAAKAVSFRLIMFQVSK